MVNLIIPDKWQQEAVSLLREGKDVVVQAPTGAGKTYIFELLYESLKGQAVYTVPTRALANDKLAEWRARGWDVGISTGDIAEDLDARVVVATLETQKGRFLRGEGPRLLVVDEYQLLADPVRGMNYELILSLAPLETQLLLLSGSVANPKDVVDWFRRIGRKAELVEHRERPVRLDEVMLNDLPANAPASVRGYWPRLIARALLSGLGPILIFAPRRNAAEELAQTLAASLPSDQPLALSQEQAMLAGEPLAKLLRNRVAYHHSGLSYAVRAGMIEPLAKRGQLRIVVATMGLAAGINFSTRSVIVTGAHYQAGNFQRNVRPDELLQMFGRAGRRGLDEVGYALVTPEVPRLHDACPLKLRRAEPIDWPSMLAVMQTAVARGEDPFLNALEVSRRLFTIRKLPVGIEVFYSELPSPSPLPSPKTNFKPCGIRVDAERGRFVRRHDIEMQNSQGAWQTQPPKTETSLGQLWVRTRRNRWRPALSFPATLEGVGKGSLCKIELGERRFEYGREIPVAVQTGDRWRPVKWLRKLVDEKYPILAQKRKLHLAEIWEELIPVVRDAIGGEFAGGLERSKIIFARFRFGNVPAQGYLDNAGRLLGNPETRRSYPALCRDCSSRQECESLDLSVTPAFAWRQLGLIDQNGVPTQRGAICSFFSQAEGLAVAAALEQEDYGIEDLIFDLGNLRAGHRFAMDDSRASGRLGYVCQQTYKRAEHPGYLELGLPIAYGAGAAEVIREVVTNQTSRHKLVNGAVRYGDVERALTEWRSLLRQIVQAPDYRWDRWRELKMAAAKYVNSTKSPATQALPALLPRQTERYQFRGPGGGDR